MSSILDALMNQAATNPQSVETAKAQLTTEPVATLEGVNAPEFESFTDMGTLTSDVNNTSIDEMDRAFESQSQNRDDLPCFTFEDNTTSNTDASSIESVIEDNVNPTESIEEAVHASNVQEQTTDETNNEPANDVVKENEAMTNDHSFDDDFETTAETANSLPWNKLPFNDRYFNFGGRTINSFDRANLACFDDIKGMAYSELLELKGFGRGSLTEVLEFLEAEGASDWLVKRKSRKTNNPSNAPAELASIKPQGMPVESASQVEEVTDVFDFMGPEDDVVESSPEVEDTQAQEVESAPIVEDAQAQDVESAPSVEDAQEVESAPIVEDAQAQEVESATSAKPRLKLLVIGNATACNTNGVVATFEAVYADGIRQICEQGNAPALSMIEFGKGWNALAATIRNHGWPQGVDVLCLSKSFASRPDIMMELRLLADVVIEG